MSRISKAFENGKAFITFITCGDPDLETTKRVVLSAIDNGADMVELGIPFSDPTAEGPVIQAANARALAGGVTTDKIFDMVRELRKETDAPLLFMTYANVVYSYNRTESDGANAESGAFEHEQTGRAGTNDVTVTCRQEGTAPGEVASGTTGFMRRCAEVGIDGIILPDVPFEEKEEFDTVCREYGVDLISLIAPTSETRIADIAASARGFIYVVSSLGVTGVRSEISTDIDHMVSLVRKETYVPCAVGFGISSPDQAAEMAAKSDGAIVGSAIMKIVAKYGKDAPEKVGEYVKEMAAAVHRC